MSNVKVNYNPLIDGLRAISIISVILFHAKFEINGNIIFKSGFLGVDIFFVISGYLITSIILKEYNLKKKFNFFNFYEKRARRLLPALLFITLVFFPFAFFGMFPSQFTEFLYSIISSIFFYSNFYFHYIEQLYQAESGLSKPYLHTWSLAVEEQFYLIFPFFFIILIKFFKRRLILITLIIFILSLIFASWASLNHPSFNFYFLPTRAWEMLSGTLVALIEKKYKKKKYNFNNNIFPKIGFLLIILSFLFFDEKTRHPSLNTFALILGVCFVIFYSNNKDRLTNFLSNKYFVFIGLISYSLYLWHYPIFSLSRINNFDQGNFIRLLIVIVLIFILSIFTYKFIELPFRDKSIFSRTKFFYCSLLTIGLIIFLITSSFLNKDFLFNRFLVKNINLDNGYYIEKYRAYMHKTGNPLFNYKNKKNILIIGDSHAQDLFHNLKLNDNLFNDYNFSHYSDIKIYCLEKFILDRIDCRNKKQFKFHQLLKDSNIVILSVAWDEKQLKYLESVIKLLKENNKKIILTSNKIEFITDKYKFNTFTILDKYIYENQKIPNYIEKIELEKKTFNNRRNKNFIDRINYRLKEIALQYDLLFLNKSDYQCDLLKKKCDILTDGNEKIYWDYGHETLEGAKYFGKKIKNLNLLKL
jgi:peptidoglycan/LPS O-acetylase OafA/YrhL